MPKRCFNPRIKEAFDFIGFQLGLSAESVVEEAFQKAKEANLVPEWLLSWRKSERGSEEDGQGIDFVFSTSNGPIFVQIKSSVRNALRFAAKHSRDNILVIVIDCTRDWREIYQKVVNKVGLAANGASLAEINRF